MEIVLVVVGVVVAFVVIVLLGKKRAPEPAAPAKPAEKRKADDRSGDAAAPPKLGAADEDDDLTFAAKIPVQVEAPLDIVDASTGSTDDGDESDESSGIRRFILVSAVARTDVGRLRKDNEDCYLCMEELGVFVVADGMGGHAGGEFASALCVDTIGECFRKRDFEGMRDVSKHQRVNELVRAIERANEEIRKTAAENPNLHDMGTTVVAARFSPSKQRVFVASVGDSRIYRVREGDIVQLTKDHTLAVEVGAKGKLGAQLTRALGVAATVRPDVRIEDAKPGDRYLLCSDGLTKMLSNDEIKERVLGSDLNEAAKSLIAAANERGGKDNITVVLVRVDDARPRA